MIYTQTSNVANDEFRQQFIYTTLTELSKNKASIKLLDVGAGLSPYRSFIESLDILYFSHDHNLYIPKSFAGGLQNDSWQYPNHDFVCDILEIPEDSYNVILLTEVLEHVPDPVEVLKKMKKLLADDGSLIVTVPFMSLMHQAPFYFSSGLSPYWFDYHATKLGLHIREILIAGDYVDLLSQEIDRLHAWNRFRIKGITRIFKFLLPYYRKLLPKSILSSGGFGVFAILRKSI